MSSNRFAEELRPAPHTVGYYVRAWLPAFFGVCVIMLESTEMMGAAQTSSFLRPIWQFIFGPISDPSWELIHHLIRKTGHFIGYGTLSLLFFYAWWQTLDWLARQHTRAIFWSRCALLSILCTASVASADEYHQTLLPGRTGRVQDVVLDTCGALMFHALLFLSFSRWRGSSGQLLREQVS